MEGRDHLATLLSQVLIAYTIEADGEFESRMPHRTTVARAAGEKPRGPWLVSLAMWANLLRHVTEDGIRLADLARRSGIRKQATAGMERWGYVTLDGDTLHLTRGGVGATRVWQPIEGRVESRWRARFGSELVDALRSSVAASTADIPSIAPDYLPVVGYGLSTADRLAQDRPSAERGDSLSAVLSSALITIAVAFERHGSPSVALAANVLRVLDPEGMAIRDVPVRSGVAREVSDVSLGYLEKQGLAWMTGAGRDKSVAPTAEGIEAQRRTTARLAELDARFESARDPLERILSNTEAMVETLRPPEGGWRLTSGYAAQTKRMLADPRSALPHFPIVTHRGGYPDGS